MRKPKTTAEAPQARFLPAVPIDKIDVPPDRQRTFNPAVAEGIAASIPVLSLKQPIELRAVGDRFRLIDGLHRLEGVKRAGWTTVPAMLKHMDERDEEASAALNEAMANLLRIDLTVLDRMAHLSAAKAAHDKLNPETLRGRPRVMTRGAEEKLAVLPTFSFSKMAAEEMGLDRRNVNKLTAAWEGLSPNSRMRLRGSRLADHQSELMALARLEPTAQSRVLDYLLSDPPEAKTVAEAWAKVMNTSLPSEDERRWSRYHTTIKEMSSEEREKFFDGMEDEILEYAGKKGWLP